MSFWERRGQFVDRFRFWQLSFNFGKLDVVGFEGWSIFAFSGRSYLIAEKQKSRLNPNDVKCNHNDVKMKCYLPEIPALFCIALSTWRSIFNRPNIQIWIKLYDFSNLPPTTLPHYSAAIWRSQWLSSRPR